MEGQCVARGAGRSVGVPMRYRIRSVDADDPDIIAELDRMHLVCFDGNGYGDNYDGWWWIAYDGFDEPAGFCGMVESVHFPGKRGYLCHAGVLPEHRGRGLQKRMIRVRLAAARRLGWGSVVSDTLEGNAVSANNLIECGFRMYEPVVKYAAAGSAYWIRRL